jgi:uncharacterized membrane protein
MPVQSPTTAVCLRTAVLGFATGLRSQLPLALLSVAAGRGDFASNATGPLALLRTRAACIGFGTAAVGELIADKTPFVPNRIDPGPFAGRLVFGGLTGAVFARGEGASPPLGFALGTAAAGLGAVAGYRFRTTLDRETGLPDPIWAVAEDLIAFTVASVAIRPQRHSAPLPPNPGGRRMVAVFRTALQSMRRSPPSIGGKGGRTLLHSPPNGYRLSAIGYRLRNT